MGYTLPLAFLQVVWYKYWSEQHQRQSHQRPGYC
jgi:hypothetical protein